MDRRNIVSREEWLVARKQLLAEEKALSRQRDAVSAQRRELPWVKLDKDYVLAGLQLAVAARLRGRPLAPRLLLAGSALAVLVATGFALTFATQGFYGTAVELPTMLRYHALVNAIGFLGLGLLAWSLLRPRASYVAGS